MPILTRLVDCDHWNGDYRWCDCGLCDGTGRKEVPAKCTSCGDDAEHVIGDRALCGICRDDEEADRARRAA